MMRDVYRKRSIFVPVFTNPIHVMLFNSVGFLLFFPVVCLFYLAFPARWTKARNLLLLAASYYFYMNWEPAYALLLLTSTVATYVAAIGIDRCHGRSGKKRWLAGSLVLNLGILFLFKYYNFLATNIEWMLATSRLSIHVPRFSLLLPVGISFYTFQALGYSIDVYRGRTPVERDFWTYALFVSFFPQLVAGPIERSNHLLPQFKSPHTFCYAEAISGLWMMVCGYAIKLVLADRCGTYVDPIFDQLQMHNGGSYLVASLLFPFQIYGDFAGYSLIAIGTARVLGFRLMENFRRPYLSCSVGEFWHRWHISLSTWFKDYVYIPMGGNRVGRWRQYLNLMLTFVVSGLWHGANWTFLCWGALHGIFVCVEKALRIGHHEYQGFRKFVHWLITFVTVTVAWVFFRARTISDAIAVLTGIFTSFGRPVVRVSDFIIVALCLLLMLMTGLRKERKTTPPSNIPQASWPKLVAIALLIAVITLFGVLDSSQFIYFQF